MLTGCLDLQLAESHQGSGGDLRTLLRVRECEDALVRVRVVLNLEYRWQERAWRHRPRLLSARDGGEQKGHNDWSYTSFFKHAGLRKLGLLLARKEDDDVPADLPLRPERR